jgi:hypothetical protein
VHRPANGWRSAQPHLSDEISDLAIQVIPPALPHQIKPGAERELPRLPRRSMPLEVWFKQPEA